ncbi:GlsB/YeaQ/YmgE family stress response membrane protein [Streptomyces sp. NPDC090127]|uniref:GlsB/YeaQ/YmgE family stress response membrane protein n=1 Tax=Streptomyces sp. NPDC090127 TaxID=3365953 RepID=UPI003805D0E8
MGIIAWIVIGLLAGLIAKALTPGRDPGGLLLTTLIGIGGGLLGGWLGKVIFKVDAVDGFFELSTWIAAVVGSVVLLLILRLFTGRRSRHA